jgi:uncharacterized protein
MQDADAPDGLAKIAWEDEALEIGGKPYEAAIESAVRDREWVIRQWAPPHLETLLSRWYWKDKAAVSANRVWLDSCKYLYMPRLHTGQVFADAVRDGVAKKDWFGYAARETERGLEGLLFGSPGSVYLDDLSLLVRPDAAQAAIDQAEAQRRPSSRPPAGAPQGGAQPQGPEQLGLAGIGGTTPVGARPRRASSSSVQLTFRRFHGTVALDHHDPIGSFTEVVQNVIEAFSTQYGTEVTITVDIEARKRDGFDPRTVRNVRENAGTLKFKTADFEED